MEQTTKYPPIMMIELKVKAKEFLQTIPLELTNSTFQELIQNGCSLEYCQLIKLSDHALHIQQALTIENFNTPQTSSHYFLSPINLSTRFLTEGCSYPTKHWTSKEKYLKIMQSLPNGSHLFVLLVSTSDLPYNFKKNDLFYDATHDVVPEIKEINNKLKIFKKTPSGNRKTEKKFYARWFT